MPVYRKPRHRPSTSEYAEEARARAYRQWEGHVRKPWHARTQVDGLRFSLGYYATKAEAAEVEKTFREKFTANKPWRRVDWTDMVDQILEETK